MIKHILHNDWATLLEAEFNKDYFKKMSQFLIEESQNYVIYPKEEDIFNALNYTSYADVKVVILGQDPYHGPDQAEGLSFSVQPGVKIPPSLRNIYKELEADLGYPIPNHGSLTKWAKQGVLLLNNVLTVRQGEAHSHQKIGWEIFTNRVIELLNQKDTPVVYLLWGAAAQQQEGLIDIDKHFIIKSPHPSPLSSYRGFFGSRPFSKANAYLTEIGRDPVDWEIESI